MEDFQSHTDIKWQGNVGVVEYGSDRNMIAMFYTRAVHNKSKSQDAGRPVYEDQIFVRIHPPGERLNIVDRPINQNDKRRFPQQWQMFQENKEQVPDGTPIELLYPDHPSIAAMLRAHAVHTIELCAALSADAIENIGMGCQQHVNNAQKYLAAANKGVAATQLRAELEKRDQEINTLKHTIDLLKGQITTMQKAIQGQAALEMQANAAGVQLRPQFPGASTQMAPAFDAQTAMINATHGTSDVAKNKKVAAKSKLRKRTRINK